MFYITFTLLIMVATSAAIIIPNLRRILTEDKREAVSTLFISGAIFLAVLLYAISFIISDDISRGIALATTGVFIGLILPLAAVGLWHLIRSVRKSIKTLWGK